MMTARLWPRALVEAPLSPVDPEALSGPLRAEAKAYTQARAAQGVDDTSFDVAGARAALAATDRARTVRSPIARETIDGVPSVRVGEGGPLLVYFHGGGFVGGTWSSHGQIVDALVRATRAEAVFPEYRLAPEHRFPAAHEDAERVVDALAGDRSIILAGDSVGAALALHVAIRARDAGDAPVAALALFAPMLDFDPSTSHYMKTFPRARTMVSNAIAPEDLPDPRLQVLAAEMRGLPPVLIQVGGADYVRDDGLRLATTMASAGAPIVLESWPNMPHVWHRYVPEAPEAGNAIERAGRFVIDHLAAGESRMARRAI